MRSSRFFVWVMVAGAVFLSGCGEPAELSAAKEITAKVAKARALMEHGTEASYG